MMKKLVPAAIAALCLTVAVPAFAQQQNNAAPQAGSQATQSQSQSQKQAANPSKSEIRQVQEALNRKGFKAGRDDGVMGPETMQALKDFQSQQKLQSTGQIDNQTLAALGMKQGGASSTVGQGSKGSPGNQGAPSNNQKPNNQNQGQNH